MAALLARQHMLKEKHAIEEQEEQLRRKKEQLQLEADIAATVAKVNVLRIGSTVRSTTSRKSNGMESYFKTKDKTFEVLNADAETFVPQTLDEKKEVKSDTETDNIPVTVQTSGLTGAGGQDCKLAIVPVKVKSKKSERTVETHAFLDQGSSASFCTVGLLDKLNLAGRKTKILLRTMGQEKVVDSFIVTELEVAGLDSDVYCEMPDLFTQHRMPVNVCSIPKQQDLDDWPHLKHIYLPEIEAQVELLNGMHMPRALEPLEVVWSVGDGPFAIKTVLGWTVNGPLGRECCGSPGCPSTVTANRISSVTLDKLWKEQFKMDFPESQPTCLKLEEKVHQR
ncbi:hypothetical protein SRHO_G00232480 [Serrasalmus rhombeus]